MNYKMPRMLINMNPVSIYRGIEGHPTFRALQFGAEAGTIVGTYMGEKTVQQIAKHGASSGIIFSQEYFEYEISAIRMGAQI